METGMERITLVKEWNGHTPGSEVEVDPDRAEWLRENGYEMPASMITQPEPDDLTARPVNNLEEGVEESAADKVHYGEDDLTADTDPDKEV